MAVLGVVSQKGGVGKTTVALNLALAFARRGTRTALVDVDPQGGIGFSLTGKTRETPGLTGWRAGVPIDQCLIKTKVESLSLMPVGSPPWNDITRWSNSLADGRELEQLAALLSARFDLVMFDAPAGLFAPTQGVFRAATHLLAPLQAEPLALRTVPNLLEAVAAAREEGARAQLAAVVLTMVKFREEISASVAQEAWGLFPESLVLEAYIPRDPIFVLASAKGVPVGLLAKRPPPVASVFDRVAQELEPRLGIVEEEGNDEIISLVD